MSVLTTAPPRPAAGGHTIAPDVLATFERRIARVWRRDGISLKDPERFARLVCDLLAGDGFAPTAELLTLSGIRDRWNRILADDRARFLAGWTSTHLRPPVLDLLGGDFTVLRALLARGFAARDLVGCERPGAYNVDLSGLPFAVHPFTDADRAPGRFASVLISTVLHHEPDPRGLLDTAAATGARRWVIVENCLDGENDRRLHRLADEFFNRCLNTFDVACPAAHRTAAGWRELLGTYGSVAVDETRRDVPGLPFPHTLFVVDR